MGKNNSAYGSNAYLRAVANMTPTQLKAFDYFHKEAFWKGIEGGDQAYIDYAMNMMKLKGYFKTKPLVTTTQESTENPEGTYYAKDLEDMVVTNEPSNNNAVQSFSSEYDAHQDYMNSEQRLRELREASELGQSVRGTLNDIGAAIGKGIDVGVSFSPLWWAGSLGHIAANVGEGNYKDAVIEGALAATPFAAGKALKVASPLLRKGFEWGINKGSKLGEKVRPMLSKLTGSANTLVKVDTNLNLGIGQVGKELPALSQEQIEQAFNLAKSWHLNRINSDSWVQRARNAGFTETEIPLLRSELTTQLNKIELKPESLFLQEKGIKLGNINSNFNGKTLATHYSYMAPGNTDINQIYHGVELNNPHMSYQEAVDNFLHEIGHGYTSGLGTSAENAASNNARIAIESKAYPLTQRMIDYNASLIPKQTKQTIVERLPHASLKILDLILGYVGQGQEQMARGYVGLRNLWNLAGGMKSMGKTFDTNAAIKFLETKIPNMKQLYWYGGDATKNMYGKMLGVPLAVGSLGTAAMLNTTELKPTYRSGGLLNYLNYIQ